jgi:hypothetical protein
MAENRVTIEGTWPPGTAIPVTGTVTPSGTQNVSIVSSPATVPVSGTVTATPSGTQDVNVLGQPININMPNNTASNPMYTYAGMPAGLLFYSFALTEVAGTVATNNFLSLFNPVASGKTITVYRIVIFPWSSAAATTTRSMTITRTTAASAGTLVAASTIPKFATSQANSISDVRTGNPTVTATGLTLLSFPPAITSAGSGVGAQSTIVPPTGASFNLAPGEGIVFNVAAGDVDQLWNLSVVWSEN